MAHLPVLISEVNNTRYAICSQCDSNIESWYFDGDDDRLGAWTAYGIFVTYGNNGAGYLQKNCEFAPAIKSVRKLVSA